MIASCVYFQLLVVSYEQESLSYKIDDVTLETDSVSRQIVLNV